MVSYMSIIHFKCLSWPDKVRFDLDVESKVKFDVTKGLTILGFLFFNLYIAMPMVAGDSATSQ